MTDTPETLQSALDDLTRRVAAFEKAARDAVKVEPPMLTADEWRMLEVTYHATLHAGVNLMHCHAATRLRYLESAHAADQAELARLREENAALREAQKAHGQDITSFELRSWADDNDFEYNPNTQKEYIRRQCRAMAREIARRRGLTLDGAK